MDIDLIRQRLEATRQRVARIQRERPSRVAKEPSTPRIRGERRAARLEKMLERQQTRFAVNVAIPDSPAPPITADVLEWLGSIIASNEVSVRLQPRSLRIERRGELIPDFVVDAVADHAAGIAATLRDYPCPECQRPSGRIQSVPDAPAGESGWAIVCRCGRLLGNS